MAENTNIQPFLKWAGGKRWLVKNHPDIFPVEYNRYIEPFLGSAAVFFHLKPKQALLSDTNSELINTYISIRDNYAQVEALLNQYQKRHSKEFYYQMRSKRCRTPVTRAAKFLYLNRTCWNGLYRVNLKGQFNVPVGTKTNVILDSDNFEALSKQLQGIELLNQDFEKSIDMAEEGDFIFADPPYTVKHNQNGFVKYNETLFSWEDQLRLKDSLYRAKQRGAIVLLTNADHDSIKSLYLNSESTPLVRNSVIAGTSSKRGKYSELVINL